MVNKNRIWSTAFKITGLKKREFQIPNYLLSQSTQAYTKSDEPENQRADL